MSKLRSMFAAIFLAVGSGAAACSPAQAQIGISVSIAPPALPVYAQPAIPGPGYIWTPGHWAWNGTAYYWVPGTWVLPPAVGLLWTPPYWGFVNGAYVFNAGYWGPHVGFYGGINYGFGYVGVGYAGGYWSNGAFSYNTAVNNISNANITNTYNKTVVVNNVSHASYNGGAGGTAAKPTPQEIAASKEQHVSPTKQQLSHQQAASKDKALLASNNHGKPPVAATGKPGELSKGVAARTAGSPAKSSTPTALTSRAEPTKPAHAPLQQQTSQRSGPDLRQQAHRPPLFQQQMHARPMMMAHRPAPPGGPRRF